jgi:hypothetical protein
MFLSRFKIDYALVGERDGNAGRRPDPGLWRKDAYRKGYAEGLLAKATLLAGQGAHRLVPQSAAALEGRS